MDDDRIVSSTTTTLASAIAAGQKLCGIINYLSTLSILFFVRSLAHTHLTGTVIVAMYFIFPNR